MSGPDPDKARDALRTRLLIIFGVIVPCVLFVVAMIAWTVVKGLPAGGGGLIGGTLLIIGIAVIGGGYWLADRYWINPRG